MKFQSALTTIFSLFLLLAVTTKSQDFPVGSCGDQADGALCAPGFCCSKWGWCGNTTDYCSPEACQSQCPPSPPPPSPPPPSPPQPLLCGIQHGGITCPPTMCCTVLGHCANSRGPQCSRELCQSQCGGEPTCGVNAGGVECIRGPECCTKAGFCAPSKAPSCLPPFCQSGCWPWGRAEPKISMLKATE